MSILDKINNTENKNTEDTLSREEYEYLFTIIRETNFKGSQVEFLYRLVAKLQKQYLKLK